MPHSEETSSCPLLPRVFLVFYFHFCCEKPVQKQLEGRKGFFGLQFQGLDQHCREVEAGTSSIIPQQGAERVNMWLLARSLASSSILLPDIVQDCLPREACCPQSEWIFLYQLIVKTTPPPQTCTQANLI